jgi:hypothetical protein
MAASVPFLALDLPPDTTPDNFELMANLYVIFYFKTQPSEYSLDWQILATCRGA